jgi:hypothetical protein
VNQLVRHVDLGLGDRGLDDRILELALERAGVDLAQPVGDVLAQLADRVELAVVGGELVVGLRQVLGLDVVDRDREPRVLAGELRSRIVLRERDRDRPVLAGARAEKLVLEPGHEPAGAQLDQLISSDAAGELLPIDASDVVDHHVVAVLGGALDGVERRQAVAQLLDLLVDLLLLDVGLATADLETLVLAELGDRAHADLDRELERLSFGGKLVRDVELRLSDGRDPGAVDRVGVPAPERAPDGLVEDRLAAEPTDHDRRRHLALTESRDAHLAAELARGLLDAPLDLLGRDFRLDAHARLGQLRDVGFDAAGHGDRARR